MIGHEPLTTAVDRLLDRLYRDQGTRLGDVVIPNDALREAVELCRRAYHRECLERGITGTWFRPLALTYEDQGDGWKRAIQEGRR